MSFPRYPKYKDSGVEWLGEVPEHWGVKPLKRCFTIVGGSTPASGDESLWDGDIPWATPSDLSALESLYVETTQRTITTSGLQSCGTTLVPAGTVILSTRAPIGSLGIAATELCTNQGCKSLVPHPTADSKYFAYLLSVSTDQLIVRGKGTTFLELSGSELGSFVVPVPDTNTQRLIATFLDRETAKIDALIAEQQRLIELLQEKRQAVISHAVTKGLNPDAPMKDSGIDWLGEVPEHWKVAPLKQIVSVPITDGPHETPSFLDEGVPFVSAEAVSSGRIDFAKVRGCISEEDNARYSLKYAPQRHDIYMVKSGATTGVTAIVEERTDFNIWSPLAAIRCGEAAAPYFVLNFIRSRNFQEAVTLNWSYGTQQNIGMGVIENLPCVLPPIPEQHAIVAYLNRFDDVATPLVCDAERAIALLQERRSALISAAVTGQIDVRGLAGSEAA
jgi:type I restriction enzyme, S subunit